MATVVATQETDREIVERAIPLAKVDEPFDEQLDEWPLSGDTPSDEFRHSRVVGEIGRYLIANLDQFHELGMKDVRPCLGLCVKHAGLNQFFSECDFVVQINYRIWQELNPWQRVALVYHELRHAEVDEDGKATIRPHDFEGFHEELALFGTRAFADWMRVAATVDQARSVTTQYDLPLLSAVE